METKSKVSGVVEAAAASDLLWELGVVEAMAHFKLRHGDLKRAKKIALTKRPKAVAAAQLRAEAARQFDRCVRIELLHPGIHRRLAVEAKNGAEVGRDYGITRARVGQVRRELGEVVARLRLGADAVVDKIEAEARTHSAAG